ncbi:angiopoietin-4 [Aplysia californica]|uniref:Angiopoietin-4 n=1 Tax=Aplysia californica TaxID=6500 RepID=A0ABM1VT09_APLCA|nr:angiopoietin-4 [Aplysia californica]
MTQVSRCARRMEATWIFVQIILAAVLTPTSNACVLNVTTSEVEIGLTSNVSLDCFNLYPPHDISDILLMRILKWDHEEWSSVAELQRGEMKVRQKSGDVFVVEGSIDSAEDSFLRIIWPVATDETTGQYRCDVITLTFQENVVWQKSRPVFITRKTVLTVQILGEIVEQNKRECSSQLNMLKQNLVENVTSTMEVLESGFENKLRSQLQVLGHRVEENKKECQRVLRSKERQILKKMTAPVEALGAILENKLEILWNALSNTIEENKKECQKQKRDILENMEAALEKNKREVLKELLSQRQELEGNLTATMEALEDVESELESQLQVKIYSDVFWPRTCTDAQALGPRPVVRLNRGMTVVCDTVTDGGGWVVIQVRSIIMIQL